MLGKASKITAARALKIERFDPAPQPRRMDFGAAVTHYRDQHLRLMTKPKSQLLVLGLLVKFAEAQKIRAVTSVTRDDVRSFLRDELDAGLSPWTVNGHLIKLRSFFKWLVNESILFKNPAAGVPIIPQQVPHHRCVAEEAIVKAAAYLPTIRNVRSHDPMRLHDLVMLASNMGFRLSEMLQLDVEAVDFKRSRVTLTRTKNKTTRPVPMNDVARAILERRVANAKGGRLFYTKSGAPIGRENILRDLQAALAPIGLHGITFHGLRHYWITKMYNLHPPEVVRVIAGNSPETARRHYIHSDQFQLPVPPSVWHPEPPRGGALDTTSEAR